MELRRLIGGYGPVSPDVVAEFKAARILPSDQDGPHVIQLDGRDDGYLHFSGRDGYNLTTLEFAGKLDSRGEALAFARQFRTHHDVSIHLIAPQPLPSSGRMENQP